MPSSAAVIDDSIDALARSLAGEPVLSIETAGRGGNSRIFRVRLESIDYALKIYPPRAADPRDRLGAETAALGFFAASGVDTVPRLVSADPGRNAVLLEWIEGEAVVAPTAVEVDTALGFLGKLARLRHRAAAMGLFQASEACLSAAEVERQIDERLLKLEEASRNFPDLSAFLKGALRSAYRDWIARGRDRYAREGLDWDADLDIERQSLSPSDFGFHNAMRRKGGGLVFLDFEYFGWDDPAKLVCDVLLHPGMDLPVPLKRHFLAGARSLFGSDPALRVRLDALYPLFGLRWCAILLNEFLPEKWAVRTHAGDADAAAAHARQLAKAEALLQRLTGDDPIRHALDF